MDCPGPLQYYDDLGCTPVYRDRLSSCPIRYNCDHVNERSTKYCYINGHSYEHNQILAEEDGNVCDGICICRGGLENEVSAFECDNVYNCTSLFPRSGCYIRKDPSKCCGDPQEICPEKTRPTCVINDDYMVMDGEEFFVHNDPMLKCICQPGYKGQNIPPFCIRLNHSTCDYHPSFIHVDYFYRKCAPIFLQNQMDKQRCYFNMKCPNPHDTVVSMYYHNESEDMIGWNDKYVCLYGELKMRRGDVLKLVSKYSTPCIKCICEVPPVPTCEFLTINFLKEEEEKCDITDSSTFS